MFTPQYFMKQWTSTGDNTRRIHITHYDLDGYGCIVMADERMDIVDEMKVPKDPHNAVNVFITDYDEAKETIKKVCDLIDTIPDEDKVMVLITDFSFKQDMIDVLCKKADMVLLVDHHQTCPIYDNISDKFMFIKDTVASATRLMLYTLPHMRGDAFYNTFSASVSMYDLGNFGDWYNVESVDELSYGLRLNLAFWHMMGQRGRKRPDTEPIIVNLIGYAMKIFGMQDGSFNLDTAAAMTSINIAVENEWNRMRSEYSRYIRTMQAFRYPNMDLVGAIILDPKKNFFSIAKEIMKNHPEIPYMVGLYINSMHFSICTTREDINVGQISKLIGGGGHPGAAGCTIHKLGFHFNVEGQEREYYFTHHTADSDLDPVEELKMNMKLEEIKNEEANRRESFR